MINVKLPPESDDEGDRIIRFPELKSKYGISWSRMHIDREEKAGRFPLRFQIGPNSVGWVEREIKAYVKETITRRVNEAPPGDAA